MKIAKSVKISNLEQLKETKLARNKFFLIENEEKIIEKLLNSSPYDYYRIGSMWEMWESLNVFVFDGDGHKRELKRSYITEYDTGEHPVYDLAPSIKQQLKQQKINSAVLLFEFKKSDDWSHYKPINEKIFIPASLLFFFLIKNEKQAS
jgi:hypothetical protein